MDGRRCSLATRSSAWPNGVVAHQPDPDRRSTYRSRPTSPRSTSRRCGITATTSSTSQRAIRSRTSPSCSGRTGSNRFPPPRPGRRCRRWIAPDSPRPQRWTCRRSHGSRPRRTYSERSIPMTPRAMRHDGCSSRSPACSARPAGPAATPTGSPPHGDAARHPNSSMRSTPRSSCSPTTNWRRAPSPCASLRRYEPRRPSPSRPGWPAWRARSTVQHLPTPTGFSRCAPRRIRRPSSPGCGPTAARSPGSATRSIGASIRGSLRCSTACAGSTPMPSRWSTPS